MVEAGPHGVRGHGPKGHDTALGLAPLTAPNGKPICSHGEAHVAACRSALFDVAESKAASHAFGILPPHFKGFAVTPGRSR